MNPNHTAGVSLLIVCLASGLAGGQDLDALGTHQRCPLTLRTSSGTYEGHATIDRDGQRIKVTYHCQEVHGYWSGRIDGGSITVQSVTVGLPDAAYRTRHMTSSRVNVSGSSDRLVLRAHWTFEHDGQQTTIDETVEVGARVDDDPGSGGTPAPAGEGDPEPPGGSMGDGDDPGSDPGSGDGEEKEEKEKTGPCAWGNHYDRPICVEHESEEGGTCLCPEKHWDDEEFFESVLRAIEQTEEADENRGRLESDPRMRDLMVLLGWVADISDDILGISTDFDDAIKQLVEISRKSIQDAIENVRQTLSDMRDDLVELVEQIRESLSVVKEKFQEALENLGENLEAIAGLDLDGDPISILSGLAEALSSVKDLIIDGVTDAAEMLEAANAAARTLVYSLHEGIQAVYNRSAEAFGRLFESLRETASGLWDVGETVFDVGLRISRLSTSARESIPSEVLERLDKDLDLTGAVILPPAIDDQMAMLEEFLEKTELPERFASLKPFQDALTLILSSFDQFVDGLQRVFNAIEALTREEVRRFIFQLLKIEDVSIKNPSDGGRIEVGRLVDVTRSLGLRIVGGTFPRLSPCETERNRLVESLVEHLLEPVAKEELITRDDFLSLRPEDIKALEDVLDVANRDVGLGPPALRMDMLSLNSDALGFGLDLVGEALLGGLEIEDALSMINGLFGTALDIWGTVLDIDDGLLSIAGASLSLKALDDMIERFGLAAPEIYELRIRYLRYLDGDDSEEMVKKAMTAVCRSY